MSIRKIIAPLTGGERDHVALRSAFAAAKPFDAHVVALFVRPDPADAMPFFGEGVSAVVVEEVLSVTKEAADRAAGLARASLALVAESEGVTLLDAPKRAKGTSASFRDVQGNFADCIAVAARLADLVAFGPLSEGDKPGLMEALEEALLQTGRPVLLSAIAPPSDFGRKIALAWDGSLTSAHAATAALPYLARAQAIEVLSVRRGEPASVSQGEIDEYLSLHGLPCTHVTIDAGVKPVGEVLLESASQGGASLLVLGAYGHSRLRELFTGGVTRHVVSHATLPLFLAH
jgi:nucleotide-binding universal stress UspA family protein